MPEDLRDSVIKYAGEKYDAQPDTPFRTDPDSVVLRHAETGKWFALFMYVKKSTLGIENSDEYIDILNVKADPMFIDTVVGRDGYMRAYHMNKRGWLTVLLDGRLSAEEILDRLDDSFFLTANKREKLLYGKGEPKDWLIPANPKYYDVIGAFEENEIIDWKQGSDIRIGDIVYLYVAAPYSCVLFKCEAVEVNIPFELKGPVNIKKMMKIKLLYRYKEGAFSIDRLRKMGVYSVRGPRSVPKELKEELER